MNLIGNLVYSKFLVPTEVPRLATAIQHKLSSDLNEIKNTEPTAMLVEGMGVGTMSSPASLMPPLINNDELSKGAEDNRT